MSRPFLLLVVFVVSACTLFGQVAGRLTGTVIDPAGASVPNATVNLFLNDGKTAVLTTKTSAEGNFDFVAVRAETYRVEVESAGFSKYVLGGIKVDPARETAVPPITLALAAAVQAVEVSTAVTTVDTTTSEVTSTVTQSQVTNLPVLDRQLVSLFYTQAGVTANLRSATVINGLRPSYTNVTLDGINLQDAVRTNAIDLMPNKLTIAQVAEFTVSTANANVTIGGGASTITMVTPSGGNEYHGSGYWYNRNSHFGANDWFSNRDDIERPFVNLNQLGGTFGGRIIRDKLFFYTAYEAYRLRQNFPTTRTILTPTARQGILQYPAGNTVRQFNVLQESGLTISPAIRDMLSRIPEVGNTRDVGDGLNTTGYSFNARNNETRDNVTVRGDYNLSTQHVFSGSFSWNRVIVDRPDYSGFYSNIPAIYNDDKSRLFSVSWRWNPKPTLTNELRGGASLTPTVFASRQPNPAYLTSGTLFTAPLVDKLPEGRTVNTWILQDNANWVRGKHSLAFGFQTNQLRTDAYVFDGTVPTLNIGLSTAMPYGFSGGDIPGASNAFIGTANTLLATLAGLVGSADQTFNATGKQSGYVPGEPSRSNLHFNQYALYLADTFKARRGFTLTLGLRWDYMAPVNAANGLQLQPVTTGGNPINTLRGNFTLDLFGEGTGRALHKRDLNNFAPNVGFAWDVFGNGRTAIRGGYMISYVNDNTLNSLHNTTIVNPGLFTDWTIDNLNARVDAPPRITEPQFAIPTSAQALFEDNPSSPPAYGMVDPNLRMPYVQQWNFGIQHELKGFVVEARYVGNHAVKMFRNLDVNQINVFQSDFVEDFKRARSNAFLSQAAGRGFVPAYNAAIPGSQQLTFFPRLPRQGLLTNTTILGNIRTGEIGTLAQNYQSIFEFPSAGFSYFPNPLAFYQSYMTNFSHASYNSAQFEVNRRTARGFQFQANYVFSKALSDASAFRSLDAVLDNNNPGLERSRPTYDLTHSFKMNHVFALPFGPGRKLNPANPALRRVVEGWSVSGLLFIQSGSPVAIYSGRGTLNRGARSGTNTVDTTLTLPELKEASGLFMTGTGPYWIDPRHIGSDGRGVAPDGSAPFAGQIFFHPQPGNVGSLSRRVLDGPGYWRYDFSVQKETRIAERHSLQLRADFFNVFNHPSFYLGDQNVGSANFGKIIYQNYSNELIGPRAIQFGMYWRF